MKLEEFLKENEGKPGMAEKLTPENLAAQGVELSDDELDLATGGYSSIPCCPTMGSSKRKSDEEYLKDSKGRVTHWITPEGKIYYYACPRCKRVTHLGTLGYVYCDPCDAYWNRWTSRRVYTN